ncbi:MAG: hypothetical protein GF364_10525 [Candidatus Lokiarchaeota archaeon]|nr:hypothetical protein [Candidatus Lokiarchaeota archaeon]
MRVRNRDTLSFHKKYVVVVGFIPILLFLHIGLPFLFIFNNMQSFQFDCGPPDPSGYISPINYTQLSAMAYEYDDLFEKYHIPTNQAIPIRWDETFSSVERYYGDDGDIMIWTGTALAAQCFRYHTAKLENNSTEKNNALRTIRKLLNGISMALKVPNGGLGREYPAVLARYWGSPDYKDITPRLFDMQNPPDPAEESYYNGSGMYGDYRYCSHTSNDQHAGFYLGLGMALEFVAPDELDIKELVTLMIDQICFNMIRNNFLIIDGNGNPNGADQKRSRIIGELHALTVLKLGANAHPDKYADDYYYYLLNEQYIETLKNPMGMETLTSYYSLNFNFDEWLTLILLEKDPILKTRLFNIFESGIYNTVRYHRNVWFNTIYLACRGEVIPEIKADIEDQLIRFNISHFPDRGWAIPDLPMGDGIGEYQFIEGPKVYNDWFTTSPYGGLYALLFGSVGLKDSKLYTNKPVSVEYRKMENFLWQRNPFRYNYPSGENKRFEETGLSFMAPYWLCRAMGVIPAESD